LSIGPYWLMRNNELMAPFVSLDLYT